MTSHSFQISPLVAPQDEVVARASDRASDRHRYIAPRAFLLALITPPQISTSTRAEDELAKSRATGSTGGEEVIVTPEKWIAKNRESPTNITALGSILAACGMNAIEEIVQQVPGISMRSAVRGLTENGTSRLS